MEYVKKSILFVLNTKMYCILIYNWFDLAQDRDMRRTVVNAVVNIRLA